MRTRFIDAPRQGSILAIAAMVAACVLIGFSSGSVAFLVQTHAGMSVSWAEPELAKVYDLYWSSFAKGDVQACYAMEAPHFRFLVDPKRYRNYMKIVTSGTVNGVEILHPVVRAPFFVEVPMWVLKTTASGESTRIGIRDRWVKVKGQWYHLVRDPMVFPGV